MWGLADKRHAISQHYWISTILYFYFSVLDRKLKSLNICQKGYRRDSNKEIKSHQRVAPSYKKKMNFLCKDMKNELYQSMLYNYNMVLLGWLVLFLTDWPLSERSKGDSWTSPIYSFKVKKNFYENKKFFVLNYKYVINI